MWIQNGTGRVIKSYEQKEMYNFENSYNYEHELKYDTYI